LKKLPCTAVFLLLLNLASPFLLAAPAISLSGIVHDGTGARISHAQLTARLTGSAAPAATQTSEPQTLMTQTDDQGEFRVELPAPGAYRVEVSAPGFKPLTTQAQLSAEAPTASLDLTLEIDAQAETVEVTADALAAETTSTQLGETLDTKKIESVPLNGRSFTDLMAVEPGIVPANTAQPGAVVMTGVASTPPSGDANPGNLSISGQREASNGFRVNNSDVEEDVNMGTSIVPNLDSIESFRVLTSNFDAEYGNSSGGQVLVTTKSGTQYNHQTSSVCYASSSLGPVHFGLGKDTIADEIEIRWPSGIVQKLEDVKADQIIHVKEAVPQSDAGKK